MYSFYAHLSDIYVQEKEEIKEGQKIGLSCKTGNASNLSGDDLHLHFEARSVKDNRIGLTGKLDPGILVDTKFFSQDPDARYQRSVGVISVSKDGKQTKMYPK